MWILSASTEFISPTNCPSVLLSTSPTEQQTDVVLIIIKHISDHLRRYLPEMTPPPGGPVAGPAHLPAHLTSTHGGSFPSPLRYKSLF